EHCTSQGMGSSFHHRASRREMIGKAVVDQVAFTKAGSVQGARESPVVFAAAFRLVDWAGRREDPCNLAPADSRVPPKHALLYRKCCGPRGLARRKLGLEQLALANDRDSRQSVAATDVLRLHALKLPCNGRCALACLPQRLGQARKQLCLAFSDFCRLAVLIICRHGRVLYASQRLRRL